MKQDKQQPFVELYDQYFDDVYRYIYYKMGNKWDADDMTSEVFRKAFEHYDKLREISGGKAWLITIARHAVIDHYRKKKPRISTEHMQEIEAPGRLEERIEQQDELDCLKRSIAYLSPIDQDIISMRYFADMKNREIGDALQKTEDAIKTRVHRMLKKLSALVTNCLEGVDHHEQTTHR